MTKISTICLFILIGSLSGCGASSEHDSSTLPPASQNDLPVDIESKPKRYLDFSISSTFLSENENANFSHRVDAKTNALATSNPTMVQNQINSWRANGLLTSDLQNQSSNTWPTYQAPSLSSTEEGPFDFSNNASLWFNIHYTDEVGDQTTFLIKISGASGENASAITENDIFFAIAQVTGSTLTLTKAPLTLTGKVETGGTIELVPIIESGMTLANIGFSTNNRKSVGGIDNSIEPPLLSATTAGPYDFSGSITLWFNIEYTPFGENTQTFSVKIDNSTSSNPEATTLADLVAKIDEAVGTHLLTSQNPLTIKAPEGTWGTLIIKPIIESGISLSTIGFGENNRISTGGLNGSGDQYNGSLSVFDHQLSEIFYYPWSLYIEQNGFNVFSNSNLALSPGEYTLELLVTNADKMFGGEGTITIIDGNLDALPFSLSPIIGNSQINVEDVSNLSEMQVQFVLDQLEDISVPRLGLVVNNDEEYIFDISQVESLNHFYLDTLDFIYSIQLNFYDDSYMLAQSELLNASEIFSSDETTNIELIPFVSRLSLNYENSSPFPSQLLLSIPENVMANLDDVSNVKATLSLVGEYTEYQTYTYNEFSMVDDHFVAVSDIELKYFETLSFDLTFTHKQTNASLGGCNGEWSITAFDQHLSCAAKILNNNILYASLKSLVTVNTLSVFGNPLSGVIITDHYGTQWGITGSDNQTLGLLMHSVLPDEYILTATLNDEIVATQTVNIPSLKSANVTMIINDASEAAYPKTSCKALHVFKDSLVSGFYMIDPDGPSESNEEQNQPPHTVYCDMETLNGGWTLIGYHGKNRDWKPVASVSPNQQISMGSGLLADPYWASIRPTISQGIMLMDEQGLISHIPIAKLNAASCTDPSSDLTSLISSSSTFVFYLSSDSSCDLTGANKSAIILNQNADNGVVLEQGAEAPFDIWPYAGTSSQGLHNHMWIYVK